MTKVLAGLAAALACIVLNIAGPPANAQAPAQTPAAPAAEMDPYQRGLLFLNLGALGDAEVAFNRALQSDAKAMGPMLGLADVALRRKQIDIAEKWTNEALKTYPNRPETLIGAARLHQAKGEYDKAIPLLERAVAVDGTAIAPLLDLGDIFLLARRQPALAEQKFRQAVALEPKSAAAHHGLAVSLVQQRKLEEARAEASEAARLTQQNSDYQLTLGRIDLALSRPDDALKAADAAVRLAPKSGAAQILRGNAYLAKKELPNALQAFDVATKVEPTLAEGWNSVGLIHQIAARWPEAEEAYRRSLVLQKDQPLILNNLAWILANQNRDLDLALAHAKRAVELNPQYGPFQDTLGWVYRARGNLTAAATALEKATTLPPANAETYLRLGLVYQQAGDKQRALGALDKALALDPDMKEALAAKQKLTGN